MSRLLGIRTESGNTIIDPVIPRSLDGFSASINYMGHTLELEYEIKENGFNPKTIVVNDKSVAYSFEENKYRQGGAVFPTAAFLAMLNKPVNTIKILL